MDLLLRAQPKQEKTGESEEKGDETEEEEKEEKEEEEEKEEVEEVDKEKEDEEKDEKKAEEEDEDDDDEVDEKYDEEDDSDDWANFSDQEKEEEEEEPLFRMFVTNNMGSTEKKTLAPCRGEGEGKGVLEEFAKEPSVYVTLEWGNMFDLYEEHMDFEEHESYRPTGSVIVNVACFSEAKKS